jgi:hypothetical protein
VVDLFRQGMVGSRSECPARCPDHRNEISFQQMVGLGKFSKQEIHTYRERVEEFADPEARHCYSCQKYIPSKYKDDRGHLSCVCGSITCYRCRRQAGKCYCCSTCHLPLSQCQCCSKCHNVQKDCRCTTMQTNSSVVQNEVKAEFPYAKKCPNCPQAWEKTEGCNHSKYSSSLPIWHLLIG